MTVKNTLGVDLVKEEGKEDAGKSWPQALAIVIACLAATNGGMLYSWASPFVPKIIKDKVHYNITESQASLFTILPPISMMATCVVTSILSDIIGRKKTLILVVIPQALAWILLAATTNLYVMYLARLFGGMVDGIAFGVVPMYIGEVATPAVRGTWGNTLAISYYMGQLIITVIGSYCSVAQTSLICITIPVLLIAAYVVLPETPYYLIMKGNEEEARKSLKWLTRKPNVEKDLAQLQADVERQMSERGTWKNLFAIASNRRALAAGVFLRVSQQMSGLAASLTSTQLIFEKSGSNVSSQMSSIIFMCFVVVSTIGATFFVDRLGRKKSYIASLIPSGLVMIALAVHFYLEENMPLLNDDVAKWIPIAGMLLYVIFNSYGINIMPTLMMGELFSASVKAKAMSALIIVGGLAIFSSLGLFHLLSSQFGLYAPFLFYGISSIFSSILACFLIPETRGKTLEQIQQSLK